MSLSPCGHSLLWQQPASRGAQVGQELLLLLLLLRSPRQERSDFVSRRELPWDSAELAPGWPCGAQTRTSRRGGIPVGARRSVPGKASQGSGYPTLHRGQLMLFFGVLQGQLLMHCKQSDTRLASDRGGGK